MLETILTGSMSHNRVTAAGFTVADSSPSHPTALEFKLCRVLVAAGHSGSLVLNDATTGRPRMTIKDIVKAAGRTVTEGMTQGPHLTRYREQHLTALWAT